MKYTKSIDTKAIETNLANEIAKAVDWHYFNPAVVANVLSTDVPVYTQDRIMEPKDQWVFFRDIDWLCPKNNRFNVDTRDFHCGYFMDHANHSDWETIKNYPHFFFTKDELVTLLERYFTESGGEAEWRYF